MQLRLRKLPRWQLLLEDRCLEREKTLAGGTCLRNLIELAVEFIQLGLDGSPPFHQLLDQCCHPRREDLSHRILRLSCATPARTTESRCGAHFLPSTQAKSVTHTSTPPEKLAFATVMKMVSLQVADGRQNHDFKPACVLIPPPSESGRSDAGILRSEWGEGR